MGCLRCRLVSDGQLPGSHFLELVAEGLILDVLDVDALDVRPSAVVLLNQFLNLNELLSRESNRLEVLLDATDVACILQFFINLRVRLVEQLQLQQSRVR